MSRGEPGTGLEQVKPNPGAMRDEPKKVTMSHTHCQDTLMLARQATAPKNAGARKGMERRGREGSRHGSCKQFPAAPCPRTKINYSRARRTETGEPNCLRGTNEPDLPPKSANCFSFLNREEMR